MKINFSQTKHRWLILCLTIICQASTINAQDVSVTNYLQQTEVYAEIYNGRMEMVYVPSLYENLPYYKNADFTDASVVFRNNYFPNQKARLDLHLEQLVILSPEKQYGIILNPQLVGKVYMHNQTIVWFNPPKENGLNPGYYIQLSEGEKVQLFCKEKYTFRQLIRNKVINYFDHSVRYYLLYNNQYYTVKNKSAFLKIFPQYKAQINTFVKDNHLNFKRNATESLTSLANYCEKLINSTNN